MSHLGNGFADAVRSVSRMRQAVAAGTLGAVAACSVAFGAMAADSSYAANTRYAAIEEHNASIEMEHSQRNVSRQYAEFYLRGISTIAQADLSALSPREAVLALKAMARKTLAGGPLAPNVETVIGKYEGPGAGALDAMTAYLTRLSEQPALTGPMVQEEASTTARRARALLRAIDIEPKATDFTFDGVAKELGRDSKWKVEVLKEIVAKAANPDYEASDLVGLAVDAEIARPPAESILISRLTDHYVAKGGIDLDDRATLARDRAMVQAADGAFSGIQRLWKEEGSSLDKERIATMANIGLDNLQAIAKPFDEHLPQAAPGR